jgi:ABC-2 type transport system permease protein
MSSLNWQGELNKYLASAYKNWIISKRNIFTIFELFFWPMISLLSIGLLTRFLKVDESMVSFLLVGSLALTVLQVGCGLCSLIRHVVQEHQEHLHRPSA